MSSKSCRECNNVLDNSEKPGQIDDSVRYLSVQDDTLSYLSMEEEGREYMIENPRYNYLVDIKDAPWSLVSLRHTLRKASRLRSREHLFTDKALSEISRILKYYLARLSREIRRFSQVFNICTRNEVYSAAQVIFGKTVSRACIGSAYQAYFLYTHSISKNKDKHLRASKSERSGLTLSVGKVFRWMIRNKVARHITDSAAIYLTATLEYLAEEICYLSDQLVNKRKAGGKANYSVLADDILPSLVSRPDIWRGAQQYEHLCVTKTHNENAKDTRSEEMFFQPTRNFLKEDNNDYSLKCFSSKEELCSLIERSNGSDLPDTPRHRSVRRRSSPAVTPASIKLSTARDQAIPWCNSAIDLLYEFVKCSKITYVEDWDSEDAAHCSSVQDSVHCEDAHPISEWIRVCGVFTKTRLSRCVDEDDVRQAARVLLPSFICLPRKAWPGMDICRDSLAELHEDAMITNSVHRSIFPTMLKTALEATCKSERKSALLQLGAENLNKCDVKGMTLLMYAALHGNKDLCQELIKKAVNVNARVPFDAIENDCIPAVIKGWTALSFAVTSGQIEIVKLLLDNGAVPDECYFPGAEDTVVLSSFHLAAAAGNLSILNLLLAKRASKKSLNDAFERQVVQDAEENLQRMHLHSLAAAHGHKRTLRKLMTMQEYGKIEKPTRSESLSLTEALAEMSEKSTDAQNPECKLRILQDAMYHSAEHGYIDITLEIRGLDIPWNYYMWVSTLSQAHECRNRDALQSILMDFPDISESEIINGVKESHIIILFDIFRYNLKSPFIEKIAAIISLLYGEVPRMEVLCAEEEETENLPKIGTKFVNNKEMADIVFNIEGEDFYAHKIILHNASKKLKELIKCTNDKGQVHINGIKYPVFEAAMQFLYSGGILYQSQPERVLELLDCAAKLQLPSLKQTCEFESTRHITSYNAVDVFTCARACKAYQLEKYCYHYFLANLPSLIPREEFVLLLERNTNILGYLEQEFLQILFGEAEEDDAAMKATYL